MEEIDLIGPVLQETSNLENAANFPLNFVGVLHVKLIKVDLL